MFTISYANCLCFSQPRKQDTTAEMEATAVRKPSTGPHLTVIGLFVGGEIVISCIMVCRKLGKPNKSFLFRFNVNFSCTFSEQKKRTFTTVYINVFRKLWYGFRTENKAGQNFRRLRCRQLIDFPSICNCITEADSMNGTVH